MERFIKRMSYFKKEGRFNIMYVQTFLKKQEKDMDRLQLTGQIF